MDLDSKLNMPDTRVNTLYKSSADLLDSMYYSISFLFGQY